MKTEEVNEVYSHAFLITELDGSERSTYILTNSCTGKLEGAGM
jgi:hypothetical protein